MSLFPRTQTGRARPWRRHITALAIALMLAGCAADRAHRDGLRLAENGPSGASVQALQRASEIEPHNARYRIDYLAQRERLLQQMLLQADTLRLKGEWDAAQAAYREVLGFDGKHPRAVAGLLAAESGRRAAAAATPASASVPAPPAAPTPDAPARLDSAVLDRRISIRLRDVPLKLALDTLASTTGLRFIPDPELRNDLRTTLFLSDARVGEALDLLLAANQLALRALDGRTALIHANTAARQRSHGELQVRTFALRHVDAAAMATLLKSMLKTQGIVTDPRTQTLVMRDTPDALQVAEQLIAANDLASGDVMIEVQVVEVSRQRLAQLGVKWPTGLTLSSPATAATLGGLRALGGDAWLFTPLSLGLDLQLQDIDANVIAQPSVRARHKEKARILIGDKVPVMTTQLAQTGSAAANQTAPATGATGAEAVAGGDGGPVLLTGTVQYIDVGLKLDVEPHVHGNGDIGLSVDLELNQITKTIDSASGLVYQLGTRQAQTSMRLHDGQTQWLGGLINRQDRVTTSGLPGLATLPVLGRLFGVDREDRGETELLLAITPRIVRPTMRPPAGSAALDSGTESTVRAHALEVRAPSLDAEPAPRLPAIDITGNRRQPGTTGSGNGNGNGGAGLFPDPAAFAPMRADMPGLPATMPRPMGNRVPRQTGTQAPVAPAADDTGTPATAPR